MQILKKQGEHTLVLIEATDELHDEAKGKYIPGQVYLLAEAEISKIVKIEKKETKKESKNNN